MINVTISHQELRKFLCDYILKKCQYENYKVEKFFILDDKYVFLFVEDETGEIINLPLDGDKVSEIVLKYVEAKYEDFLYIKVVLWVKDKKNNYYLEILGREI